jgi:hypothetical protein
VYIYKEHGIKKIEMGSGGSSRRKDTDDGDYDSDQDQYDQGNDYDDSEMQKQQQKDQATQLLNAIQSGDVMVTSPRVIEGLIGDGGLHLSKTASVSLIKDLSKSEKQMFNDVLSAHAESNVSRKVRDQLFREFQEQQQKKKRRAQG